MAGCSRIPATYQFPNRQESIESVVLLHNMNRFGQGTDETNMQVLKVLSDEEIVEFMDSLYSLPTERDGTPPSWGYGEYIAKVTYENGDVEMFGSLNIVYIAKGDWISGIGEHIFVGDCFVNLFSEYVDISQLPNPPSE